MNNTEAAAQLALKTSKPRVYEKVLEYDDKLARGESIAIIRLEWDYRCNFRCEHCCIRDLQKRKGRVLTLDDVRDISRQADELGFSQFVISGGEPLIYKDFDQVVEAIDPRKFYVTTDTNGWWLDDKRAKHLKAIGVDKVQVSIDNLSPYAHDQFRHKYGSFYNALKAIDAAKSAGLKVIVQTVVDKARVRSDELIEFIEYFNDDYGVGVCILYAKPVGGWKGRNDLLVDQSDLEYMRGMEEWHNVFSHLTPCYGHDMGCIAVKRMVNITRFGEVNPCPVMQEWSIGSIFSEPLKDIIQRGMKRFEGRIDTCLVATVPDFIEKNKNSERMIRE